MRYGTDGRVLFVIFAVETRVETSGKQVRDRRVAKTQALLHEALGSLVLEKSYESISVKDILDRANVGRSTFYMHYRDKDELLASSIRDLLRPVHFKGPPPSAKRHERLIWFGLPLFDHIHQHRRMGKAKIGARGRAILHEHLRKVLVELIADDAREFVKRDGTTADDLAPELVVQYVASTFILVLNWWTEGRNRLSANEADRVFRALVLPTLTTISQGRPRESR